MSSATLIRTCGTTRNRRRDLWSLAEDDDGAAMRDAFSLVPPYIRTDGNAAGVFGLPWFSEYGLQQTRGFRALKVWMAMKFHRVDGYRASIERDLSLADRLARSVRESNRLQLVNEPSLSIVCFRYVPP